MQAGDAALAQRLNVVAVALPLECRAFTKPAARRHSGKRHGLTLGVVSAHLQQSVDDPKPVRHRTPDAANIVTRAGICDAQIILRPFALPGFKQVYPGDGVEFLVGERAPTLVQGVLLVLDIHLGRVHTVSASPPADRSSSQ